MESVSNGPKLRQKAIIPNENILVFSPNIFHRIMIWVDLMILYFLYLFIISVCELFLAYTTCTWYFTRKKESAYFSPLMIVKIVLKFHLGTAAKLALFKFLFKQPRNIIGWIRKGLSAMKQESNTGRFVMSTLMPLLQWHNKLLRFLSKDLFVMTSMWGDKYKTASEKAFFLSYNRNGCRGYEIMNYVTFILFCTKFCASFLASIGVYYYISTEEKSFVRNDLSLIESPLIPFLVTFGTSMFIVSIFVLPFDMILRTIIQCY